MEVLDKTGVQAPKCARRWLREHLVGKCGISVALAYLYTIESLSRE